MTPPPTTLRADDHVLFGARDEAKPQDWRIGRVLAAHDDLVVVTLADASRRRVQMIAPADVIAISRSADWLQNLTIARQVLEMRLRLSIADVLSAETQLAGAREMLWASIDGALGTRSPVIDSASRGKPVRTADRVEP